MKQLSTFSQVLAQVLGDDLKSQSSDPPTITVNNPEFVKPEYVRLTPVRESNFTLTAAQLICGILFFVFIGMALMASLGLEVAGLRPLFLILGVGIGYCLKILRDNYKSTL